MKLICSSPSPKSQIPLFSAASAHLNTTNNSSKFPFNIIRTLQSSSFLPPLNTKISSFFSSKDSASSSSALEEEEPSDDDNFLKVRRPVMDFDEQEEEEEEIIDDLEKVTSSNGSSLLSSSSLAIDAGLSKFAKKMPIFEPERVEFSSKEKPLGINLELALYRAKVLGRNYCFDEAKQILQEILCRQSKFVDARVVYERGCQATQGENPYIWQCWAVLENKMGNIRKARELFDAATVADKRHIAAWHGWAVLELKQGNVKKARNLLGKGLKYCGGNEYVYQTLALLEAKANRVEQARYLFKQATKCNPKSCASWLAWAQMEMQQENNFAARQLFEKAVQASPKNRFAWHVWGVFEATLGFSDKGRKLLKIGHALNPRDPVLLQSLALLEYKESTANLARLIFRRASELDPRHQPVWIAWGWMEWKEGNIGTARQLYQRALSIDSTSESAARCLQAWGVLEQRAGNLSAARRLFRSSLNINSQSYITWMTWAAMEEEQGNSVRAEEIRDVYYQQRTEVVDDASWVMGFLDVIDPALERIKRLLNFNQNLYYKGRDDMRNMGSDRNSDDEVLEDTSLSNMNDDKKPLEEKPALAPSHFDLDAFVKEKLSLDTSKLEVQMETSKPLDPNKIKSSRSVWRSKRIPTR
ncbi:hypothetical protein AQUCO_02900019v1 [Aquilegia coerulea]|uniref:Uncharacterized protein n=1 Tax=Aquilegia coerulea TaxID=218851 RepID=A0A2G5D2Z6_AQUCA|nr:hypothetical protein AQUCO_02900019v1 [Aquilegia coerulea]